MVTQILAIFVQDIFHRPGHMAIYKVTEHYNICAPRSAITWAV